MKARFIATLIINGIAWSQFALVHGWAATAVWILGACLQGQLISLYENALKHGNDRQAGYTEGYNIGYLQGREDALRDAEQLNESLNFGRDE
jgi:hypothetical protein